MRAYRKYSGRLCEIEVLKSLPGNVNADIFRIDEDGSRIMLGSSSGATAGLVRGRAVDFPSFQQDIH